MPLTHYSKFSMFTLRIWVFKSGVLNNLLQCPVVTIRRYPWSAGSWQVFHIVGLCVFSHQSADYSIVVVHLTSNNFEGHPCCMHADYLSSGVTIICLISTSHELEPCLSRIIQNSACSRFIVVYW
jgi:hypothetical protein